MNVYVKYVLIDEKTQFHDLEKSVCLVSQKRQEQIQKYRFDQDKIASLTAGLLIRQESCRFLGIPDCALSFSYNSSGKPFLNGYPDYGFSVSHSGRAVAFACGYGPVGVDIQKEAAPNAAVVKRYFALGEQAYYEKSREKKAAFYELWTKKEAYLKMLGTGLSTPLASFDVTDGALAKTFRSLQIPGYRLHVCSNVLAGENGAAVFEQIGLPDLLVTGYRQAGAEL